MSAKVAPGLREKRGGERGGERRRERRARRRARRREEEREEKREAAAWRAVFSVSSDSGATNKLQGATDLSHKEKWAYSLKEKKIDVRLKKWLQLETHKWIKIVQIKEKLMQLITLVLKKLVICVVSIEGIIQDGRHFAFQCIVLHICRDWQIWLIDNNDSTKPVCFFSLLLLLLFLAAFSALKWEQLSSKQCIFYFTDRNYTQYI